jgi:hypothetical protein
MSYYTLGNPARDYAGLFTLASNYGKTILRKSQYETAWVVVISWKDLRPYNPGNFGGVST